MRLRALLLLLVLLVAGAAVAQAQTVSLSFFHDSLTPYGDWMVSAQYGNVFRPHVAVGWRPYLAGHWVYSDFGWTWVADESWGWATYHYGRWYLDPVFGWCWVPGYEWAPAWVDWQWGDGWIGWAPLPPQAGWTGFGLTAGAGWRIAPAAFVFVPQRNFLDPGLRFRVIDSRRNAMLLRSTRNVTRYGLVGGTVAVRSLPVDQVQRFTGRTVPRYQVVSSMTRANPRVQGNRLVVYRPQVTRARPSAIATPSRTATMRPTAGSRLRQPAAMTPRPLAVNPRPVVTARRTTSRPLAQPSVAHRRQQATRALEVQPERRPLHVTPSHAMGQTVAPPARAAVRPHLVQRPVDHSARQSASHPVSRPANAPAKGVHEKRAHPAQGNAGKPPAG